MGVSIPVAVVSKKEWRGSGSGRGRGESMEEKGEQMEEMKTNVGFHLGK